MKKNILSRKEEIILTTISLIHEFGIGQLSMKEIGRREGVSEASLYRHFRNKEELLSDVLAYYEKYDIYIRSSFQGSDGSMNDNIRLYFNMYSEYYENYREITALLNCCDSLLYDEALGERVKKTEQGKLNFLTGLIEQAQKNGELQNIINPKYLSCVLLGTFREIIRMWRQLEYSFPLKERTNEIIDNVVQVYAEKRR